MSPTSADRSPLLAVDDSEGNILLQAAEPPPLELPEPLKSEGRRLDSEPEELRPPQLRRIDTDDGSAAGAPSSSVEDEEERMVHEPHRPTSFGSEILATSEKLQSQQQQQQQEEQEPSQPQSQTPTVPRSSPVAVPGMSWDCAAATGSMDVDGDDGAVRLASSAPACNPPDPPSPDAMFVEDAPASSSGSGGSKPIAIGGSSRPFAIEDDGAQSAIHALLALQRDDSPRAMPSGQASSLPLSHFSSCHETSSFETCPPSPTTSALSMDSPSFGPADGASSAPASASAMASRGVGPSSTAARFYCRYPKCGKGYASTDAVRKHCRQRHLEWLRRLGHGCPALYCRWEE